MQKEFPRSIEQSPNPLSLCTDRERYWLFGLWGSRKEKKQGKPHFSNNSDESSRYRLAIAEALTDHFISISSNLQSSIFNLGKPQLWEKPPSMAICFSRASSPKSAKSRGTTKSSGLSLSSISSLYMCLHVSICSSSS